MAKGQFQQRLDAVAAFSMILASAALLAAIVWFRVPSSSTPSPVVVRQPATYLAGEILEDIPGLELAGVRSTLILYLKSTCRYCTESMPFYRRLAERRSPARLVVIGPESPDVLERYVEGYGFRPDQIIAVDGGGLRFRGTPTLLLVDADGRIRKVWLGRLDARGQSDVELSLQ